MNGESGFRMPLICDSSDGRSLTQCRERDERTALKDCGAKGSWALGEGRIVRVCEGRRLLNGRDSSRYSKVGEESADVRYERREDSGGESGAAGTVRARAMLHAFAPRSRTWGKCREIS